jgi:hypothetical protein
LDDVEIVLGLIIWGLGTAFMIVGYILEVVRRNNYVSMFLFGIILMAGMTLNHYHFYKKNKEWKEIKKTIPQLDFSKDADIPQMLTK